MVTGYLSGTLYGNGGDDEIWVGAESGVGGDGNDLLHGDEGDKLVGQRGNDTIFGGFGNDVIHGNRGNDTLHGNRGDDQVFGGVRRFAMQSQAVHRFSDLGRADRQRWSVAAGVGAR